MVSATKTREISNSRFAASFLRMNSEESAVDENGTRNTLPQDTRRASQDPKKGEPRKTPHVHGGKQQDTAGKSLPQRAEGESCAKPEQKHDTPVTEETDALHEMAPTDYARNLNIGDLVLEISHLLTRARSPSPKRVILEWLSKEMRARRLQHALLINRPLLDYLPKLSRASSGVTPYTTENKIYQASVKEMLPLMDCDRANIYLYNKKSKNFAMRSSKHLETAVLCENKGLLRNVMESNKAMMFDNCAGNPRFQLERESDYISRNMLVVPVRSYDGETIGMMQAVNKNSSPFNDVDSLICSFFMQHIAVLMRNANTMKALAERKKDTDLFLALFNALAQTRGIMKDPFTLQVAVNNAKKLVAAERCVLYFLDAEEQELLVLESDMPKMKNLRIPMDEGITGAAMHEPQIVSDVKGDPRYDETIYREMGYETRNILAVPLRSRPDHEALGVLEFHNKRKDAGNEHPDEAIPGSGAHARARQGMSRRGPVETAAYNRTNLRTSVEFDSEDLKKIVIFSSLIAAYMEQDSR